MPRKFFFLSLSTLCFIIALTTQIHSREDRTAKSPLEFRKSILDVHSHLACLNFPGCYIRPEFRNAFKFKLYMKASGLESQHLERSDADEIMVNTYIQRLNESELYRGAIVYALDGYYDENGNLDKDKTDVMVPNDYIHEVTQKNE